jgi:hypothetical protein
VKDSQLLVLDMSGTKEDDRGCVRCWRSIFLEIIVRLLLMEERAALCAAVQGTK